MIELKNVTKTFDEGTVTAVDSLSFTVKEGEIVGLIGTSGCGKTTTLKMINRLEEPTSGSIFINGKSILNQPPEQLRRGIGYVIQNVGLFPHYSVRKNIATTPELLGWDDQRINKRTRELLQMVGLGEEAYAHRSPADLSGGQQQRVGLARALAADPSIILMDEPFGALDPITKERIRQEFKELLNEIDKTIVLVTHDVFEAFDLCDRICLMDAGKARQIGTSRELLFQPADEFVHSFFDTHRFQLEMMSVTMGDILGVLDGKSRLQGGSEALRRPGFSAGEGDDCIYINDSFYSFFEQSGSDIEKYHIVNSDNEMVAQINSDDLLEGFQQVRRNLREDRHD